MEELIQFLKIRENIYKILSYAFYMEPDIDYINDLKSVLIFFKTAGSADNIKELTEGVSYVENFLKQNINDKVTEELACEFARLFLVMNIQAGIAGISANESVYRSEKKILMQESRDEVLMIYASQGIAKNKDLFREPEDHISAEMYFMSEMSLKSYKAIEANNESETEDKLIIQYDFLNKHLIQWIDKLCADVWKLTKSDFYRGIAKLSQGFIKWDEDKLSQLIANNE